VEDPAVQLLGVGRKGGRLVDAGHVGDRVDGSARSRHEFGQGGVDRGAVAHVDDSAQPAVQVGRGDVEADDGPPLAEEPLSGGPSHTAARSGDDGGVHRARNPPSTTSSAPVMNPASSLTRKATAAASSSGPARRPSGVSGTTPPPGSCAFIGVLTPPGTSALT